MRYTRAPFSTVDGMIDCGTDNWMVCLSSSYGYAPPHMRTKLSRGVKGSLDVQSTLSAVPNSANGDILPWQHRFSASNGGHAGGVAPRWRYRKK
jgi:hypothetical protein